MTEIKFKEKYIDLLIFLLFYLVCYLIGYFSSFYINNIILRLFVFDLIANLCIFLLLVVNEL